MKRAVVLVAAALAIGVVVSGIFPADAAPPKQPDENDLRAGERLYAENCAACHGVALEGAGDWQSVDTDGRLPAPPHDETGHTWHHGDALLFTYTKFGGREMMAAQGLEFDSGMPGFGETLSDQQIWDTLAFIKSTWPERVKEIQAVRTEAEQMRGE